MYLTREEEAIINGELGEQYSKALKVVVKVGEALGAEKLIKVSHAHISGISYYNIGDYGLNLMEDLAGSNVVFSTYTTANPYASVFTDFASAFFDYGVRNKQLRIIKALAKMGARAFTCAPYYVRRPVIDEHLAWAESNAVLYANSVIGARTNKEGGPLALMAAIVGRTYYWGMHRDDERRPDVLVNVITPLSIEEASTLGYLAGKVSANTIPYIRGLGRGLSEDMLRAFLSSFAVASGVPMVFIEGVTPRYKSVAGFAGGSTRYSVSREELMNFIKKVRGDGRSEPTLYIIGCPHLSHEEVINIVNRFLTRCCRRGEETKELWILTYKGLELGRDVVRRLAKLGVKVLFNVCPIVTKLKVIGVSRVVTDSVKALYYIPKVSGVKAYLMDREDILREFLGLVT